jgi:hypothetical protein
MLFVQEVLQCVTHQLRHLFRKQVLHQGQSTSAGLPVKMDFGEETLSKFRFSITPPGFRDP